MKSLVSRIMSVVLFMSFAPAIFAESGTTEITPISAPIERPLLVDSITPVDDMHVNIVFNQDILKESVRVRIAKQSDESNIRIDSFTGGTDPRTVQISLVETLSGNTAYKMTVISAISQEGVIIKDGADALKEFTTPADLKKYAPVLNAPSNPNAVLVNTGSSTTTATATTITPVISPTSNGKSPAGTAEELPPTGTSSTLIVIAAALLALVMVFLRRRAV